MRMLRTRPTAPAASPAAVAAPAMPAAGPRTRALAAAALPAPAAPAQPAPPGAMAPAAAMQQTHSFLGLLAQTMARGAANGASQAMLLPMLASPEVGREWIELQAAVTGRLLQLQQDWWQGWAAWVDEFAQLRRADTLSEHLEQQYNLGAQFGAMLRTQAADLLDLQDNTQVDFGYWAAQKLGPARPTS